ncbi:calcium-binding protein [Phormidium sp. CCY1219]|uniref:calcium-binding protein n=1 Tax=Phormidium sp. CCY1219 TaxID=2886104 RepID=UPI002D1F557E|nr:hypothetical protein [Phormidium sp. CCY1219]MEB3830879.1 hypothetical protein [Phormidium sp. CCY1219]
MVLTLSDVFNPNYYRSIYPDIAQFSDPEALQHFRQFGLAEGRQFSPVVDLDYYQSLHPDLQGLNRETLLQHLLAFGISEGRSFSPAVDLNYYQTIHPDLSQFIREEALQHLIEFGLSEGRSFFPPSSEPENNESGMSVEEEPAPMPTDGDSIAASDNSVLNGSNANDTLLALGENSTLVGSQGNDSLFAANGAGSNLLQAKAGNNVLVAGANTDTLVSGSGNDFLVGSAGNDTLESGAGNDSLSGGLGADSLVASAGISQGFVYQTPTATEGNDTVTVFESGTDRFYLKRGVNHFDFAEDAIGGLRTQVDFFAVTSRSESYSGTFALPGGTQLELASIVFDAQPGEGGILYYDPSGGVAATAANSTGDLVQIAVIESGEVMANDIIIF